MPFRLIPIFGALGGLCSVIVGFPRDPIPIRPASVAQLDARPTGDQEVVGSTSAGSA